MAIKGWPTMLRCLPLEEQTTAKCMKGSLLDVIYLKRFLKDPNGKPFGRVSGQPQSEIWVRLRNPFEGLLQVDQPLHQEMTILQHEPLPTGHGILQQLQRHLGRERDGGMNCLHGLTQKRSSTKGVWIHADIHLKEGQWEDTGFNLWISKELSTIKHIQLTTLIANT